MSTSEKLNTLKQLVSTESPEQIYRYVADHVGTLLADPHITAYYQILSGVNMIACPQQLPRLVVAWLAFLCGDNGMAAALMETIRQPELDAHENALFYDLKAISGFHIDTSQRLYFAKLAVDVLPQEDASLYMGNAQLTYGQILAGSEQYRQAAEAFCRAHGIFQANGMPFPAVVSFVNEMLNRFNLGEFQQVLGKCSQALIMSSSYKEEAQACYSLINLPVGMCYFELNKPSLATKHLNIAMAAIDEMALLHMHGLVEWYLFKSCYLLKDQSGMRNILEKATADFGHMNYMVTNLTLSMFRIFLSQEREDVKADIEFFEVAYAGGMDFNPVLMLETMACLKLRGFSEALELAQLEKRLAHARFTGHILCMQMCLAVLAELHFRAGRTKEASNDLEEVAAMAAEYGIHASLLMLPLTCLGLLADIDAELLGTLKPHLSRPAKLPKSSPLTARERDILRLAAEGKSNGEIGKALYIGVGTIKWHMNQIFRKLDASNRIGAIDKARKLNLI